MSVCSLFVLGQLLWTGSEGSQLFAQTGNDVTLDIMDPRALKNYLGLFWKFNTSKVLVSASKKEKTMVYSERVVFHPQNSSVTLKNLQKSDSGLYEAQLIRLTEHPDISRITLSVQDPVSPVTVTVDSVSNSSESCNFTVSCSTENIKMSHSFTCFHNQNCKKQEYAVVTATAASLRLYLSNVSIICNHSNQVSWTKDTWDIPRVCPTETAEEESVVSVCELKTAVFSVGLLLMVSAVISVHVMDCIKKKNV